jgi:hypothetical protein
MLTPGAKRVRHFPMLEKVAILSFESLAPTVIEDAAEAGDMVQASAPRLLPAATMETMPFWAKSSMTSLIEAERGPPRDRDTMAVPYLFDSLWFFTLQRVKTKWVRQKKAMQAIACLAILCKVAVWLSKSSSNDKLPSKIDEQVT